MKREAEVVRQELMPPRPATVILTGATRAEVAKAAGRGVMKGKYGTVSEILPVRGGGYAAKATLIPRPERRRFRGAHEPLPTWARVLVRLAWAVAGILVALALVIAALSALIGSLVNLPWMTILGAAVVILILLLAFPPTRSAVTVIVKVFV